jgi:uncharacterized protein
MDVNKTVLITGASSGIGYELSKIFAFNGYKLILVARNKERLTVIADELMTEYNCLATVIQKDLSIKNSAVELFKELSDMGVEVDVLVNNAGIGNSGTFHETDLGKDLEMLTLNIESLTVLTKLFSKKMAELGEGKILNIASTGAYQPGPYIATYYATKAYVLSLSESISNELKNFGVTVSTLCPGATMTEFSKRAGKSDVKGAMSPKAVADIAFRGLMKNKGIIIPGFTNKIAVLAAKLLPRRTSADLMGKVQLKLLTDFKKTC